jgi:uncharacterized membrane protein
MDEQQTNRTEEPPETEPEVVAEAEAADEAEAAGLDPKEFEAGKTFALLSYLLSFVGIPFFAVPLITRDNDFALYHAKQAALGWIATAVDGTVAGIVSIILTFACIGYVVGPVLALAITVAWVWLNVQGAINASKGVCAPLPITGEYAEEWFKGLTKKES